MKALAFVGSAATAVCSSAKAVGRFVSRPVVKAVGVAGSVLGIGTSASAQVALTIPTEMDPMTLVNNALSALAPVMLPALSLVAIVGVALGFVRFVWGAGRKAGRGG